MGAVLRVGEVNILKLVLGNLEGGAGIRSGGLCTDSAEVRTTGALVKIANRLLFLLEGDYSYCNSLGST